MTQMRTRAFAVDVTQTRAVEGDDNTFEFVASTENEVRVFDWERFEVVREVLKMDGADVKNYERNPVVLDAHRQRGSEFIAGRSTIRFENDKLLARVTFDDAPGSTGERNARLVRKKMLRALSIGYAVRASEDAGFSETSGEQIVHVTEWELVEISTVPVPADPDALKRAYLEQRMTTPTPKPKADPKPAEPAQTRGKTQPPAPEPKPAPEPAAPPTLEEEGAAARKVASELTSDKKLQDNLVRFVLEKNSDDPSKALKGLEAKRDLVHARTADKKMRELAGKLLAESEDPLTLDVLPALRKALAADTAPVGTPTPPTRAKAPEPKTPDTEPAGAEMSTWLRSF